MILFFLKFQVRFKGKKNFGDYNYLIWKDIRN